MPPVSNLASYIDHTVLKPATTKEQVQQLCEEAMKYGFAAVCVPPYFVEEAVDLLKGSTINIATVIGFPLGYSTHKLVEIEQAKEQGATEVDVVINIAALKSGNWEFVAKEIDLLTNTAHRLGLVIKFIIETALLTNEEIEKVCILCANSAVDYVKTSTGFAGGGATIEHVKLMRSVLPATIKIKASGGIKDRSFAEALINVGANRLGCSRSIQIVES